MSREKRQKVSDLKRLDALMRSVYGCTLDQFLDQFADRMWQAGYKQGIKGGRRLAKGKSEFPKRLFSNSRGRPPVLAPLLQEQFLEFVNDFMRQEGISLRAAVSRYHSIMGRAWKHTGGVPNQEALLRLYKRATKTKFVPDASTD